MSIYHPLGRRSRSCASVYAPPRARAFPAAPERISFASERRRLAGRARATISFGTGCEVGRTVAELVEIGSKAPISSTVSQSIFAFSRATTILRLQVLPDIGTTSG